MRAHKRTQTRIMYLAAIIFLITIFLCSCSKEATSSNPSIHNGSINLEKWNFNNKSIKLNGKWEFYWNKLLSPEDFKNNSNKLTGYYKVPMYWTKYKGLNLPPEGFATYRLNIKTNGKLKSLGLKIPEIYTEYKLWINGDLIAENGMEDNSEIKYIHPNVYSFPNHNYTIEVILQIKNFSHSNAGIGQSIILGTSDQIYRKRFLTLITEIIVIGICLFAGIYYAILFLFRRKSKQLLFFGLFCISIALRTIFTGQVTIMEFIPQLSFDFGSKISLISVCLCTLTFITFSYYQFQKESSKLLTKISLILNLIYFFIIVFTPLYICTTMFKYYFIIILISIMPIIYVALKCAAKNNKIAIVFSIGLVFLCISGINDMLYYLQKIDTGYYLHLGFLVFIMAQSIMLGITFSNEYSLIKELSRKLQILDRLKDDFLANTSHELRTPLNGIIGISESLIDGVTGALPDKTVENLKLIVSSGKRLSSLINDILDFSRLKNNDIMIRNHEVDFNQIVSVVITIMQSTEVNSTVLISNNLPSNLPLVQGDENRLQQVMYALLGNAIKFTKEGCIIISAKVKNKFIEFCVEDTGIGISKDKFQNIFEPFEQVENSSQREFGGTGLGLAITKKIIELHGGSIWVESKLNAGTKIYFTLRKASNKQKKDDSSIFSYNIETDIKPLIVNDEYVPIISEETKTNASFKILVVDDEMINLQVMTNILAIQNYTIETAVDGISALELLERNSYDLILLDIMMPKMSGYEVCKRIRKFKTMYELPIIILTSKNQPKDITTAFQLGANDYVVKPFDKSELLSRIKTQLTLKNAVKSALDNAYLANTDALTGLYNRRYLYDMAEKDFLFAKQNNSSLSVIMIDVDAFKKFNDTYGHSIGDKVLKKVSSNIKKVLREKDIAGRYGGEEFIVILPNTNLEQSKLVAEDIRVKIENTKVSVKKHSEINCTASLGVAVIKKDTESIEELIKEADILLYKAKENGKNRVEA